MTITECIGPHSTSTQGCVECVIAELTRERDQFKSAWYRSSTSLQRTLKELMVLKKLLEMKPPERTTENEVDPAEDRRSLVWPLSGP